LNTSFDLVYFDVRVVLVWFSLVLV